MTICVFGASITWGSYDPEGGGWVNRLRNELERKGGFTVYNLGVSGDTTDDLLERIAAEAEAREPDMIVFSIGVNDSQYLNSPDAMRTPPETFEQNIRRLIETARAWTKRIVFVGFGEVDEAKTMPIPWSPDKYYTSANLQRYDDTVKSIAEEAGLQYIPLRGVVGKENLEDGLHPNPEGHRRIFEAVKEALEL